MSAYWLNVPDKPATTPTLGQSQESDDTDFVFYIAPYGPLMAVTVAVLASQPIQIGMRVKGSDYAEVLFGAAEKGDSAKVQLLGCMVGTVGDCALPKSVGAREVEVPRLHPGHQNV